MNDSIKISKIVIISRKKNSCKIVFFPLFLGVGVLGRLCVVRGWFAGGEEGFLLIIRRRRIWLMYALVVR